MALRSHAVIFVHGLARKPSPGKLKELWQWGLSQNNPRPLIFAPPNPGLTLDVSGVPELYTYYADVFYGEDYETEFESYYEGEEDVEIGPQAAQEIEAKAPPPKTLTPREARFIHALEAKLNAAATANASASEMPPRPANLTVSSSAKNLEIASWLPGPVKKAIIKQFAMEAYYFLFDKEYTRADGVKFMVRQELRERLIADIRAAREQAEKVIIVSHSMGTMIAYDVLRNCQECPPVDILFTLGSPLGVQEVQDELRAEGVEKTDFPSRTLGRWINIYDKLDPVCGADPQIANDFDRVDGKQVEDLEEGNWGNWRHTITHYFAGKKFRAALKQSLGLKQ